MNRSEALAAEFERVSAEFVDYIRGLNREQWLTLGVNSPIFKYGDEDENRPVGTIAHHVASAYKRMIDLIPHLAAGEPLPRPEPGAAARHAAENADPDHAGTVQLLEERGAQVAAFVRGLSDEDLDREATTFLGQTTIAVFIERAVNFHPVWHLTSIKAALDTAPQRS